VSLNIWSNTTGFSGFYYLVICSDFTTDVFMPDSGRWINALLAIADRSRRDSMLRSLSSPESKVTVLTDQRRECHATSGDANLLLI
jgi:hypothetical protein